MSGFTSIELLMLLDSGAAYHSPQGIRVRTANLSPAVKALVAARLKATPCAACKAAAAQALLAAPPVPASACGDPCTCHASYARKDVGAVAVSHSVFARAGKPATFVFHARWELNALEELLLTEIQALRAPTPEETQQMREDLAHWAAAPDVCKDATAYRLTLDLAALGTARAFQALNAMLYKPGADEWLGRVIAGSGAAGAAGGS